MVQLGKIGAFTLRGDERGSLIAIEGHRDVPFDIRRVYYIYGTLPGVVRGRHAHRELEQVLVCVRGACTILLNDGKTRNDVVLDRPDLNLYVGPMIWHDMYDFTPDCVLLVLASDLYDEADYIRDEVEFEALIVDAGSR